MAERTGIEPQPTARSLKRICAGNDPSQIFLYIVVLESPVRSDTELSRRNLGLVIVVFVTRDAT